MHPDISSFARDVIYEEEALHDANTIQIRDAKIGWDFGGFPSRRAWIDIDGRESGGVNIDEINAMEGLLQDFIRWARDKGRPDRDNPKHWEVACLCFYSKQEKAISDMLRRVTGESKEKKIRFFAKGAPVEIVCGTVDRFQGREADLVLLSMRNTRRTGFLDSPNRLNVAVTRARQQLVIFGNYRFYGNCHTSELEELAIRTPTTHSHGETPRRHRRR
jgi:superfamily I DNA and/or RNA helicase